MTAAEMIAALQAMPPSTPITLMLSNEHATHCYLDFTVEYMDWYDEGGPEVLITFTDDEGTP
jgi:hypothetical protein